MSRNDQDGGRSAHGYSAVRGALALLAVVSLPGAPDAAVATPGLDAIEQADSDADTVGDSVDNCTEVANPDQRDSNADGFGNACDADLNNDGVVNFSDLGAMKGAFFSASTPDADLNGDGYVNFVDLGMLRQQFFQPPGPGNGGLRVTPVDLQPFADTSYRVLAVNDLGMHCADLDYQVFSILPPFNVVHAQVVRLGTSGSLPSLIAPDAQQQPEVVYSAASSQTDPALSNPAAPALAGTPRAAVSINSSSRNDPMIPGEVYKSNFWEINPRTHHTWGYDAYGVLYPGDALSLFEPIPHDLGIPVPDPAMLPALQVSQQAMPSAVSASPFVTEPYAANAPQRFARFDSDLPFFATFPFGTVVADVNWWSADGIPVMPVDDAGRDNSFPLVRVQARDATGTLASLDVVLPVASEADCQLCHAVPADCADPRLPPAYQSPDCNGAAISPTQFTGTEFTVATIDTAPGPVIAQQLLNAAKINILRLHDAKHGAHYTAADGTASACDPAADPADPDCLDNQQPVQCARCHYSPALDLAQVGPIDEPAVGPHGRQQTRHVTMSRALHDHHGQYTSLFPAMPPPVDQSGNPRPADVANDVLERTCYACHPGKRTRCLRGVMADAGIVCQDCHGGMPQVGDDFSENLPVDPFPGGADLSKRVPWASEPSCQSCHTGDALTTLVGTPGMLAAPDGIRLVQAWLTTDPSATPIAAPGSRFATSESLYRLSKGHAGLMCEGCHGSTHAEWPVGADANDDVAALQLQGHEGTLIECTTCHSPTAAGLPLTLEGPHGMHPIADYLGTDQRWNTAHGEIADGNGRLQCRGCHGAVGEGTALARTAKDRRLHCDNQGRLCADGQDFVSVPKGTEIGCGDCHQNPF